MRTPLRCGVSPVRLQIRRGFIFHYLAAQLPCFGPGSAHSSSAAAHQAAQSFGALRTTAAVHQNSERSRASNGSSAGERPSVFGGGTATPDGQHVHDERAEQREVVRRLCPMGGEHARPPAMLSRALLPRDPLLTLHGGLVWQENGPQLRAAADPHQAAHRRRAGGRSSSTTRRRRGKCSQPPPPPIAGARPACCELARIAPIGAVGWIYDRVSRA